MIRFFLELNRYRAWGSYTLSLLLLLIPANLNLFIIINFII
ncbi:hypothetical protein HMPREF1551_02655 [Capnocytophaga sp. oral taxon 863 str. F0517]|nr:hypothetical protein HMPREF1551_02655 [Capnocytophaga sp. oral taxon 863 str. F0517]